MNVCLTTVLETVPDNFTQRKKQSSEQCDYRQQEILKLSTSFFVALSYFKFKKQMMHYLLDLSQNSSITQFSQIMKTIVPRTSHT